MKSTLFNIFLIFLLAGIVFFIVLKDDGKEVFSILGRVSIFSIIGLVFLMIVERILLGWGLMKECQLTHPEYNLKQGFVNAYVAGLFCNITPGASGGQIAQSLVFRKQGIPVSASIGILWLDFLAYQTTMSALVLFLLLFRFHYFFSFHSQFFFIVIVGFLISAFIIVILWLIAKSERFYQWASTKGIGLLGKLHIIQDSEKALKNSKNQLASFKNEINVLTQDKSLIVLLCIENCIRLIIYYSIPYFCALALHIQVSPMDIINIIALSSFVAMVNVFLPMPGSSGGTEATFVLMFSTIFKSVDAKSIMILWRLVTYYQTLIIGTIVFMIQKITTKSKIAVDEGEQIHELIDDGEEA